MLGSQLPTMVSYMAQEYNGNRKHPYADQGVFLFKFVVLKVWEILFFGGQFDLNLQ
jgi:hypothetical protein